MAAKEAENLHMMNLMRIFGDSIVLDPSITLANKILELVQKPTFKLNALQIWKFLHYI